MLILKFKKLQKNNLHTLLRFRFYSIHLYFLVFDLESIKLYLKINIIKFELLCYLLYITALESPTFAINRLSSDKMAVHPVVPDLSQLTSELSNRFYKILKVDDRKSGLVRVLIFLVFFKI